MQFEVAEVLSFVRHWDFGPSATEADFASAWVEGCSYVFHTDHRFLGINGTWEDGQLRWETSRHSGAWNLERAAGTHNNAALTADGSLRERPPASPPVDPPPKADTLQAPPPAWIETKRGSFWLGYSTDGPKLRLGRGEIVRAHLGFVPRWVRVTAFPEPSSTPQELDHHRHFPTSDEVVWRVDRAGAFALTAATDGEGGDASYVACVELC
jgi:hypothetical protein